MFKIRFHSQDLQQHWRPEERESTILLARRSKVLSLVMPPSWFEVRFQHSAKYSEDWALQQFVSDESEMWLVAREDNKYWWMQGVYIAFVYCIICCLFTEITNKNTSFPPNRLYRCTRCVRPRIQFNISVIYFQRIMCHTVFWLSYIHC